jgi:hypothetical protein
MSGVGAAPAGAVNPVSAAAVRTATPAMTLPAEMRGDGRMGENSSWLPFSNQRWSDPAGYG